MNTNTRMNRLLIAACALLAVFSILAIPGIVAVRAQGEAPLLDRELFFGDPEILGLPALPRWQVHHLHQALQGNPKCLDQANPGAVRIGQADHE